MRLPLQDILVLDFSQFLAAPTTALRLQDLGARVIKIEEPVDGDIARKKLVLHDQFIEDVSVCFNVINRGKESIALNLKDKDDLSAVKKLISKADVIIHNFRPGVMDKFGLDYESVKLLNPRVVYGWISAYGLSEKYKDRPLVDIIAQAVSGINTVSGVKGSVPINVGIPLTDMMASVQLAFGITSLLLRREVTGEGGFIHTSLLESAFDMQYDVLSAFLYSGEDELPKSSMVESIHSQVAAPAGTYKTSDGFITIAMYPVKKFFDILGIKDGDRYDNPSDWFKKRDEIISIISSVLISKPSAFWIEIFEENDVWAVECNTYKDIMRKNILSDIDMIFKIEGLDIDSIRTPITIDYKKNTASFRAPKLGEHSEKIRNEFSL